MQKEDGLSATIELMEKLKMHQDQAKLYINTENKIRQL